MIRPDRRGWLAGAGAFAIAGRTMAQAPAPAQYDYLFLDIAADPGGRPRAGFTAFLSKTGRATVQAAGGELLAVFGPALGWKSSEVAAMVSWPEAAPGREASIQALSRAPSVRSARRERLAATARPRPGERPPAGGIYVHRWFAVAPDSVAEVVALSVEGWRDYEGQFDTQIYGLFEAARSARDRRDGVTRLLLITHYRDHAAWEESRDPSAAARVAFNRRQKLVLGSWAASTRLLPAS